jgi:hypothetical protein
MQIQIPQDQLKSILNGALTSALSTEQLLGQAAQAQVAALVEELYPLVLSETQSQAAATNPAVPQAYLQILQGCVSAAIAKLGLRALADQRGILAGVLQTTIQVMVLVLKAAT